MTILMRDLRLGDRVEVKLKTAQGDIVLTRIGRIVSLDSVGVLLDGDQNPLAFNPSEVKPV